MYDPIFTKNEKCNTESFREFLKPYKTELRKLRKIGKRHAFRIHGNKKLTSKHLKYLSKIVLRQESNCLDTSNNYIMSDIELEDFDPKTDYNTKLESEDFNPTFKSQALSF